MTKPTTCVECGKPLHPRDAGVTLVGYGRGDVELYRHGGECAATATDRAANTATCRGCGVSFDVRSGGPGRPPEYHDEKCRKGHARRVARVWRDAARDVTPDGGADAITRRMNDVEALVGDVQAGRFNDQVGSGAGTILGRYHQRLGRARQEALDALRREREQAAGEARNRWVKERQAQAAAQTEAMFANLDRIAE